MKKIVYISGKMSGLPDYGRNIFNRAEEALKKSGYIVLNPAFMPNGMQYNQYMAIAFAMLQQAHLIVMLPGWQTSMGAKAEKAYAEAIGIRVYNFEELCAEAI